MGIFGKRTRTGQSFKGPGGLRGGVYKTPKGGGWTGRVYRTKKKK